MRWGPNTGCASSIGCQLVDLSVAIAFDDHRSSHIDVRCCLRDTDYGALKSSLLGDLAFPISVVVLSISGEAKEVNSLFVVPANPRNSDCLDKWSSYFVLTAIFTALYFASPNRSIGSCIRLDLTWWIELKPFKSMINKISTS